MTLSTIERLIQRFVSGEDTSIEAANEIEVALDDAYPNDAHVEQTVEMLAMYRPEGGEFLLDPAQMRARLIATLRYLKPN